MHSNDVLDQPSTVRGDDRLQRYLHGLDGDDQQSEEDSE